MTVSLTLTKTMHEGAPARITYGIPLWYRILSALITLVLLAAAFAAGGLGLGWIFVAVAVLGAVYEERWTFDARDRSVKARMGLVFLSKGPSCSFDDIARLRVDIFAKGKLDQRSLPEPDKMPHGSQARLIAELKDGQALMIDSVPFSSREKLRRNGTELADFLGVALE